MTTRVILTTRSRWLGKVVVVGLFSVLTAMTARIVVPLPFTPVPITLQVLAVVLSGLVLGGRAGAAAQMAYLSAIALGLPLTSSGLAGPAVFAGPTAGYLLAFAPAAFACGWLAERLGRGWARTMAAGLVGVLVIHLGGTAWLSVWLGGHLDAAWKLGSAPFVLVDGGKALVAAAVAQSGRRLVAQLV